MEPKPKGAKVFVKRVDHVEDSSIDKILEQVFTINSVSGAGYPCHGSWVKINGFDKKFIVDSGAGVTLIDKHTYKKIGKPELTNSKFKIMPYGSTEPLKIKGQFVAPFECGNGSAMSPVYGVNELKGIKVKLHIDESVQPVAQSHRRIPYHLRPAVEAQLRWLEQQDIIEKVEGPTPWVSPMNSLKNLGTSLHSPPT